MSIFSAIDAERDLRIVEKAVKSVKERIPCGVVSKYDLYTAMEVVQFLDDVLKYCRENITE